MRRVRALRVDFDILPLREISKEKKVSLFESPHEFEISEEERSNASRSTTRYVHCPVGDFSGNFEKARKRNARRNTTRGDVIYESLELRIPRARSGFDATW